MKKEILFIHSAGPQGFHEGSDYLTTYLQNSLNTDCEVICPKMPDPENPTYKAWKVELQKKLKRTKREMILIGHSLGASVLLKYLSEERFPFPVSGLFLIGTMYWGKRNWEVEEYVLHEDFPSKLSGIRQIYLYHSQDDEVVPVKHLSYYSEVMPMAQVRKFSNRGHLFGKGLPELIEDIKSSQTMVEVFKTNVKNNEHATMLKEQIGKTFAEYEINFDLQDCDKILRVKCISGSVQISSVINLLKDHGFHAEVL